MEMINRHYVNKYKIIYILILHLILFIDFTVCSAQQPFEDSDKLPLSWIDLHKNYLFSMGITDTSADGLRNLLTKSDNTLITYHTVLLLGRMGVKKAIPDAKLLLNSKDINVQIASAEALFLLGNHDGVDTLVKISNRNDIYALDAVSVLARYGSVEAIPYLKQYRKSKEAIIRIISVKYTRYLVENLDSGKVINGNKALLSNDIEMLIGLMLESLSDNDKEVRDRCLQVISGTKVKDKSLIIEGLKKRENIEKDAGNILHIRREIYNLEKNKDMPR